MSRPAWYPDWRGQGCVIVASGPSAGETPLELSRGRARVVAINRSWELCPWADMLYGADARWWKSVKGCPGFAGLKVTAERRAADDWGIHYIRVMTPDCRLLMQPDGAIGHGKNSGFQALNAAACFGAAPILLVGFDMTLEHGLHWHGPHVKGLSNPRPNNVAEWRRHLEGAARRLQELGIPVINCSAASTIKGFRKMPFAEAVELLPDLPAASCAPAA